jgi:hypothetical protein
MHNLFLLFALVVPAQAQYSDELAARAASANLSERREWRLLGHYSRTRWFTLRSEAAGKDFFLSPTGRHDPRAELAATLRAFFKKPPEDPNLHAQCRFPARFAWLDAQLKFDNRLERQPCNELRKWRAKLDPEGATLVFASAFLNSPGSAYGHTFIRLDKKGDANPLLNHALNFAAMVQTTNGFAYVVKGLTGLFEGKYSAMPYYIKVQEYSNLENRDLWEYRLNLSSGALTRLVDHAWEMGNTHFPYFFLTKNCSYQLLPLLEAAEPQLNITPHQAPWVIPVDTVRILQRVPGLIGKVTYRPSRATIMRMRREMLSPSERKLAYAIAAGEASPAFAKAATLPAPREAAVLDTAADFLLYKTGPHVNPGADIEARERPLHLRRGKLSEPTAKLGHPAWAQRPDQSHRSSRFGLGAGANTQGAFQELHWRFALHDPLDPPFGYVPHSQLEMGRTRLRRDDRGGQIYLDEFQLLSIRSVAPYDAWTQPKSWQVQLGAETADELDKPARRALYVRLRGGAGLAVESRWLRRESLYAFAEGDVGSGAGLRGGYRLGGGATVGATAELASWWRLRAEGQLLGYFSGDRRLNPLAKLENAWDVWRRVSLRLNMKVHRRRREISGNVALYL